MKLNLLVILCALSFTITNNVALASSTTVSDIKDANIVCINLAKSEALVFKTTNPQKIWKTAQNREGKIKKNNALQLGQFEIYGNKTNESLHAFKAKITEGYQLIGTFESQSADGEFSLSVLSTYLPDGNKSNITDYYNCSKTN